MTRTAMLVDGVPVMVSTDTRATGRDAQWALVVARIVDEITDLPPASVLSATIEEPGLTVRLGEGGRVGVLVQPWDRYPWLAAPGFTAHVNVAAPGFLPRRLAMPIVRKLTVNAPALATILTLDTAAGLAPGQTWTIGDPSAASESFTIAAPGPGANQITLSTPLSTSYSAGAPVAPGALTTVDLGDLALHRTALAIRGRVMAFATATQNWQPPASATLAITAIWRRQADVTNELAKEAPSLVSLDPGLYRDRTAGDVLQPIAVTNVGGDEKTTLAPILPADTSVRVSNARGLAPAATLQVDVDHPDVTEILPVASFLPTGVLDEPASVTFALPAAAGHRAPVAVHHVTTTATLAAKSIATDALAGDPVVFLTDVAFGGTPATAQIGSGSSAEFHSVSLFSEITADVDGYFSFPPISRVAKVRVVATVPPRPPLVIDLEPDFRSPEEWLVVKVA